MGLMYILKTTILVGLFRLSIGLSIAPFGRHVPFVWCSGHVDMPSVTAKYLTSGDQTITWRPLMDNCWRFEGGDRAKDKHHRFSDVETQSPLGHPD